MTLEVADGRFDLRDRSIIDAKRLNPPDRDDCEVVAE
jgi:hypothetical protein